MNDRMRFDPTDLQRAAQEVTGGLDDFGDPDYLPALTVLCEALGAEAGLSDVGAQSFREKLVFQLSNRLRIEHYFARYPEIADEVIAPPLVVVGLLRTGTTKLHRMLSCDPRFYWMAFWESQFPAPLPGETIETPQVRISEAKEMVRMMTEAVPDLVAMHPMDAMAADEEVMLMEHSMHSAFSGYAHVPSYDAWMAQRDQIQAYRYFKRMLQFLQWQKRKRGITAERWVLKAPNHLLHLQVLLNVFPGAHIVQTHRDPLQSIPSVASLIQTLWSIYSDEVDPNTVGTVWNQRMMCALEQAQRARDVHPESCFADVSFNAVVDDPLSVVRSIYDFIEWPFGDEVREQMQAWLEQDSKTHQRAHKYTAAQFGLSESQLLEDYAIYRSAHIGRRNS